MCTRSRAACQWEGRCAGGAQGACLVHDCCRDDERPACGPRQILHAEQLHTKDHEAASATLNAVQEHPVG